MADGAQRYFLHPALALAGHRARLLLSGGDTFPAMLSAIAQARTEVLLEMYIWQADGVGRRFAGALCEAARRGVQVRAVIDGVGSLGFGGELPAQLRDAGVQLAVFHPPLLVGARSRLTVRDHRKLLVVDGAIAFVGGTNLADAYAPLSWGGGGWLDVHLQLEGPAARECQRLFAVTWRYVSGERIRLAEERGEPPGGATGLPVQVLAIDSRRSRRLIRNHYQHALKRARTSILIMAAYFIPDRGLRAILRKAVGRGVVVRVLLPHKNDVRLVQLASQYTYGALLRAGVQVYEWLPSMMHAKALAVDGEWLAAGSYNFDRRSLLYNWELSAAVGDRELCAGLAADFELAVQSSQRIELAGWKRRSAWLKLLQWLAYLLRRWL